MTTQSIAHPDADETTAPDCLAPGAGVITQPAGATVIDRTWTGRFELQLLRLPCAAHEHGERCPHPATTVVGVAGFVQDRDDERRGAMFCMVHGQERLRALAPNRFAGGGK